MSVYDTVHICPRCKQHQVRNEGEVCTRCLEVELPVQICEIYGEQHVFTLECLVTICACGAIKKPING